MMKLCNLYIQQQFTKLCMGVSSFMPSNIKKLRDVFLFNHKRPNLDSLLNMELFEINKSNYKQH